MKADAETRDQEKEKEGYGARLEDDMIRQRHIAHTNSARDHGSLRGINALARRPGHLGVLLRNADAGNRTGSQETGPDQVRHLVDDAEDALDGRGPSERPEVLRNAAARQVAVGVTSSTPSTAISRNSRAGATRAVGRIALGHVGHGCL